MEGGVFRPVRRRLQVISRRGGRARGPVAHAPAQQAVEDAPPDAAVVQRLVERVKEKAEPPGRAERWLIELLRCLAGSEFGAELLNRVELALKAGIGLAWPGSARAFHPKAWQVVELSGGAWPGGAARLGDLRRLRFLEPRLACLGIGSPERSASSVGGPCACMACMA